MEVTLNRLSEQLPGWTYRQYVANDHNLPIRQLGLRCTPSIAVLLDGQPVAQFTELISIKQLVSFMHDLHQARTVMRGFLD